MNAFFNKNINEKKEKNETTNIHKYLINLITY